jgi:hypothetical protein
MISFNTLRERENGTRRMKNEFEFNSCSVWKHARVVCCFRESNLMAFNDLFERGRVSLFYYESAPLILETGGKCAINFIVFS